MGEVFAGRYELADPIGRGGVGAVWRAWDHRRRRYVAAKVLQQRDAHSLLRFVREQALRIDHPHVLAPASWAADDDKVLFTMDLVGGGSLVHLIGDYGPLPPVFVCTLLDQLLSGLSAVHAEGVVHRDIKPANLLLEATGTARPRLRLSDFGIAMRLGEPRLTETNLVVGTPGYLAPEQMMGAEPDFTADLFAVGLVALYLLEGAKPDAKALVQHFAEHGTPSAPKGIPEPLWQVVANLLQPDPQARFRTATGARKALASAVELLPEPGPDDELIEIFDQLGPLPKGFGPEGPLRPARAAGGTGTTGVAGVTGVTGTAGTIGPGGLAGPTGSMGSMGAMGAMGSVPARPASPPDSTPTPTPTHTPTPTGEPFLPAPPAMPPSASLPVGRPLPGRPDVPPGPVPSGTPSLPARPATAPAHPVVPPPPVPYPTGLGTHSVPPAAAGGGHLSAHPGAGVVRERTAGPHPDPYSVPGDPHPTPTPTPTPSMSDTGSFHLPPPQPTVTSTVQAPYDPTFPLRVSPESEPEPEPESAPRPGRRALRRSRRRAGPPARVAVPLLLLALACYAVGFWALVRI
ncbi:serine/threonine-protein kinase [Streptomyces sp. NPDC002920]